MHRLLVAILLGLAVHLAWRPLGAQAPTVTQIAASWHILALLSDGTVSALGQNRSGQLGRPKSARTFLPAARVDLPAKAVQVAAGDEEASYALLEDGTVWAWGNGRSNNLGVRLTGATDRHTPGQVPGLTGVARIVAFKASMMAVMRDGSVRAWGELPEFLTGGTRVHPGAATPIVVNGLADIADIAGGPFGGYAVTRDGRVHAWGSNEQGGLGHGTQADVTEPRQPTPAVVPGIADAIEVKAGTMGRQFIVRRRNGTLIGWGNSDWGQLGAGVSGDFQLKPTPIKLPDVEAYWLGGNWSFARTKDGTVWFWGEETAALGLLGVRGNQKIPAKVPTAKLVPE